MKPYCLASSSAGNCYIFDFEIKGNHTLLMVECGIPYREILRKCTELGLSIADIQACIITHGHGDHCKSAKELNRIGIPIYASKHTLDIVKVNGVELSPLTPIRVAKGVNVTPFEVDHDIEGAYGFVIRTMNETCIFVNDSKRWFDDLSMFHPDYVFIECNYDNKIVYAQYHDLKKKVEANDPKYACKMKEWKANLKHDERVINSHMSLAGTIRNLGTLNLNNCRAIFLMHLSDQNANEYRMKNEIQNKYHVRTFVCGKKGGMK